MHGESVDNTSSASGPSRGIHVAPGGGIVAHLGRFMAYAEGDDDGLNQLVVRLNALADAPWSEVVRTLTSDISAAGYENHPALACASIDGDRLGVFVFGDLTLQVTTDTEERVLDGRHSSTWIDLAISGVTQRVRCGQQPESTVVGVLRDGVVSGGGFVFDLTGPIPAATRWDAADSPDAVPTEAGVVDDEPAVEDVEDPDGALPEPEDIVDAESLNGNIFGSPVDAEEDSAVGLAESGDNDFSAVSGIFSRSAEEVIDDAEVIEPDPVAELDSEPIAEVEPEPVAEVEPEPVAEPVAEVETDVEVAPEPEIAAEPAVDGAGAEPAAEPTSAFEELAAAATAYGQIDEELPPPPAPMGDAPAPAAVAVATVPEIQGVICPSCGSLTSPQDSACRTCGFPIDPTAEIVYGTRSSLGTLTFDDGAQLQLTRPVVIGRGVPERYAINGEPATTVLLDDVQGTISRVHLEVHLVGWEVEIIDMNSTSGTFVQTGDDRVRMQPEQPTVIAPGSIIEVGQRSFTFSAGPLDPA